MKSLIGAAFVAGALAVAGPAAINPAAAAPQAKAQSAGTSDATDFSAHRHARRYHRHSRLLSPALPSLLLRSAGLLSAVSLFLTGAVHLRHRVWSVLVVNVGARSFLRRFLARSSLRSAHSWRVHVPVSNVTLGATAKKRDGDQPQAAAGRRRRLGRFIHGDIRSRTRPCPPSGRNGCGSACVRSRITTARRGALACKSRHGAFSEIRNRRS